MVHPDAIKLLATLYMKHTGITRSVLGVRCGAGQKFFFNLLASDNKGYTTATGLLIYRWFWDNWPEDLPWPWRASPPLVHEPHAEGSCPTSAS